MKKCINCKNAVVSSNGYGNGKYLECRLKKETAENMTTEQLLYSIRHPEEKKNICRFVEGRPRNNGVSFDD